MAMIEQFAGDGESTSGTIQRGLAKAAYFGYANLAHLSPESIEQGASLLERGSDAQRERLRVAFASAARVILEVEGFSDEEIVEKLQLAVPVEEAAGIVMAETLKRALPKVGRRYLTLMTGPIDDVALRAEHIPVIIGVLMSFRGKVQVDRRTLDIETLLGLRLAGVFAEDIAVSQNTSASRVKGAFFRFGEIVNGNATTDDVGGALRARLAELSLLEPAHKPTKQELDNALPPYLAKKKSPHVRAQKVSHRESDEPKEINLRHDVKRDTVYIQQQMPDDLLSGETMSERRVRLRTEAGNGIDHN